MARAVGMLKHDEKFRIIALKEEGLSSEAIAAGAAQGVH